MAAKTGKGYERHGDRFRVKVRENGKSRYVSFATPDDAAAYYANQQSPVMKAYRNSSARARSSRRRRSPAPRWSPTRATSSPLGP
jgi:hypothetical protein